MNVLFVTNAYHPIVGGVEKVAARLAAELKKLDCEVEIVTARNPLSFPQRRSSTGFLYIVCLIMSTGIR